MYLYISICDYWSHKVCLEMLLRLWSLWGSWSAQRQTSGRYRGTMVCHLLPRKLHSLKSLTCSKVLDISSVKYMKVRHHQRRKSSWGVRPICLFLFSHFESVRFDFLNIPFPAASTSCSVFFWGVGMHIAGISWRGVGDSFLWIMMQLFPCHLSCHSRTGQLQDTLDFHVISKAVDVENQWPPSQRGWTATRVPSDRDRYEEQYDWR